MSLIYTTKGKPDVPPPRPELWSDEAFCRAQIANGVDPTKLYSEIGKLFPKDKEFGVYVYSSENPNVRIGEREYVRLRTYLEHIEKHAPNAGPEVEALAELHLLSARMYRILFTEEEIDATIHYMGLAIDPEYRLKGLGLQLAELANKEAMELGFKGAVGETTGFGSYAVMMHLDPTIYVVSVRLAMTYPIGKEGLKAAGNPSFHAIQVKWWK